MSHTLGSHVEALTLTGSANINATGNWMNNTLTGNAGNNILNGGSGSDRMVGGRGNDTYHVDNYGDTIVEWSNEGTDTVYASVSHTLGSHVEALTLTGSANINATGNWMNNTLVGNGANNTLIGGSGNDSITGGPGNDRLIGGAGSDTLNGGSGYDTFVFQQAADSAPQSRDRIIDFRTGDRIDLSALSATTLKYLHTSQFTGHAGEVKISASDGGVLVSVDLNADKQADSAVYLENLAVTSLLSNGGDFVL